MFQKSRKVTVLLLIVLVVYYVITNYTLLNYGFLYYFIINPIFWVIFMILAKIVLPKVNENFKINSEVLEYTFIASFVYIGIYVVSELFVEIGKNPYALSLEGLLSNGMVYILPIIAIEYVRFKLVNSVFEKDKSYIVVLVSIAFTFIEIGVVDWHDTYNVTKLVFSDMLPIISKNILCTYIAYNKLWKPAVYYRIITFSYWLIFPILPKVTWIMISVIDTIIPMILFVYIRYTKKKKEINKSQQEVEVTNPRNIIPLSICVIIILWFGMGIFPIKPIAIATGSMENELCIGDVAILKKCEPEDVEIGDIVQYEKDNITVIHRCISKYYSDGELFFIMKGDNNKNADSEPVSKTQILAKEMFSIKYIGYPAVFLNRINWKAEPNTSSIEIAY